MTTPPRWLGSRWPLTLSLLLCASMPASAQIANGSFETTQANDGFDFSDWTLTGGGATLTDTFGDSPTSGTNQAFLTTDDNGTMDVYGVASQIIYPSLSASTVASSLGVTTDALDAAASDGIPSGLPGSSVVVNGSALTQTITGNAGDILSFQYDFLTSEDPTAATYGAAYNQDFSFLTLGSSVIPIANTNDAVVPEPAQTGRDTPSIDDYLSETGYRTFTTLLPTTGTYTLGFGVANVLTGPNTSGGPDIASALLIDNVVLTPTPEPGPAATLGLGGALVLGIAVLKARRRSAGNA